MEAIQYSTCIELGRFYALSRKSGLWFVVGKMQDFRNVVKPCLEGYPDGNSTSQNTMYKNETNYCLFPDHVSANNSCEWKPSVAQDEDFGNVITTDRTSWDKALALGRMKQIRNRTNCASGCQDGGTGTSAASPATAVTETPGGCWSIESWIQGLQWKTGRLGWLENRTSSEGRSTRIGEGTGDARRQR